MGGRGSSSRTSARSLPGGAMAMTVEFASGRRIAYKQTDAGMLMSGRSIEDRFSPVTNANVDLRGLYELNAGRKPVRRSTGTRTIACSARRAPRHEKSRFQAA